MNGRTKNGILLFRQFFGFSASICSCSHQFAIFCRAFILVVREGLCPPLPPSLSSAELSFLVSAFSFSPQFSAPPTSRGIKWTSALFRIFPLAILTKADLIWCGGLSGSWKIRPSRQFFRGVLSSATMTISPIFWGAVRISPNFQISLFSFLQKVQIVVAPNFPKLFICVKRFSVCF